VGAICCLFGFWASRVRDIFVLFGWAWVFTSVVCRCLCCRPDNRLAVWVRLLWSGFGPIHISVGWVVSVRLGLIRGVVFGS